MDKRDPLRLLVSTAFSGRSLDLRDRNAINNLYAAYCLQYSGNDPDTLLSSGPLNLPVFLLYFCREFIPEYENIEGLSALITKIALDYRESDVEFDLRDFHRWATRFGSFMFEPDISGRFLPVIEKIDESLEEHEKNPGHNPYSPYTAREFQYLDNKKVVTITLGRLFELLDEIILDERFVDLNRLEGFIYNQR